MINASRYHLHFDAGTEHVLPLSFVDEFGQALDVSCYEVSGVVLQQGKRLPVKAARPSATTAVISFPVLSSGVANYRLDMTSPAGTEIPMVFGTIHVMARETEASGTGELDALEVAIPTVSEQAVTIKILGALDLAQFGADMQQAMEEVKVGLAEQKKCTDAMKDSLVKHANDAAVHATADEKAAWNAKLSPAAADERYGFAGSIPGQVVNGQSFSTNLYWIGNWCFAKKADFANEVLENMVLSVNVDDKIVSFNDATVCINGMADINVLYVNKLNTSNIYTGEIECQKAKGTFVGSLVGEMLFSDRHADEFNQPGFRIDETTRTVSFNGIMHGSSNPADIYEINPLTIHYDPNNQKVDVANLEVKGIITLRNPRNDAVYTEIYSANTPMGGGFVFESANPFLFNVPRVFMQGDLTAQSATFSGEVTASGILIGDRVTLTAGSLSNGLDALCVSGGIRTGCIVECCHLETGGHIWNLPGDNESGGPSFGYDSSHGVFDFTRPVKTDAVHLGEFSISTGDIGSVNGFIFSAPLKTDCIIECCHLQTAGNIWGLKEGGTEGHEAAHISYHEGLFRFSHTVEAPSMKFERKLNYEPGEGDVLNKGEIEALIAEKAKEVHRYIIRGAEDNFDAHGWGVLMLSSGLLNAVEVNCRASGGVSAVPTYLKVFKGEEYVCTSLNSCVHAAGAVLRWEFVPFEVVEGVEYRFLFAGEERKDDTGYATEVIACFRVVRKADDGVGMIGEAGGYNMSNARVYQPKAVYELLEPMQGVAAMDEAGVEAILRKHGLI